MSDVLSVFLRRNYPYNRLIQFELLSYRWSQIASLSVFFFVCAVIKIFQLKENEFTCRMSMKKAFLKLFMESVVYVLCIS